MTSSSTKRSRTNLLALGLAALASVSLALGLTACDSGGGTTDPATGTARTVTVTGIDASFNGGTIGLAAMVDGNLVAISPIPSQIANGSATITLYAVGGSSAWSPADGTVVRFTASLTAANDDTLDGAWASAAIGSGNITLDWADADTSGAPEGVTDANSVRVTVSGLPAQYHYAIISVVPHEPFAFYDATEAGDYSGTTVSFLMNYMGDPWIGDAGTYYDVELWLDDDGQGDGAEYILESAFEGGTAKTVSLEFANFSVDSGF